MQLERVHEVLFLRLKWDFGHLFITCPFAKKIMELLICVLKYLSTIKHHKHFRELVK
jgi:hypothetical protein